MDYDQNYYCPECDSEEFVIDEDDEGNGFWSCPDCGLYTRIGVGLEKWLTNQSLSENRENQKQPDNGFLCGRCLIWDFLGSFGFCAPFCFPAAE